MDQNKKEVYYNEYCNKCLYFNKAEEEEPCNECLSTPAREYSHKPINYKEK